MKKLNYFTFILVFLFSCNDSYLEKDFNDYQKVDIKIDDLQSLKPNAQKVYVSGLKNQSEILELFKQKLIKLIDNRELFKNSDEINAVDELILFLQSNINNNILDSESINSFVNDWYFKTSKVVDWNPLMYKFLINSLELDFEKYKNSNINNNSSSNVALGFDCECNVSVSGVLVKDCAGPYEDCLPKASCEGGFGCGAFYTQDCNGYCFQGDIVNPAG